MKIIDVINSNNRTEKSVTAKSHTSITKAIKVEAAPVNASIKVEAKVAYGSTELWVPLFPKNNFSNEMIITKSGVYIIDSGEYDVRFKVENEGEVDYTNTKIIVC